MVLNRAIIVGLSLVVCQLSFTTAAAQNDRQYIRQGNRLFQQGDLEKAEVAYSKAVEKNSKNPQAHYNLGRVLQEQKKDSAAVESYQRASQLETNPLRKSQAFHNMGVVCQQGKLYAEAIEAYKQALRLNPADDATRYNLVLCKHQKQKQDQQKQDQQQDQQKQDQQKQEDQKQNEQKKDEQQQEKPQQPKMSKENAEQLLNAAMQQEKNTQQRMQQKKGQRQQNDKNW